MLSFYLDEHMPRRVRLELEKRGVACEMAVDAGHEGWPDEAHLAYAAREAMVMVTRDEPFAGRAMQYSDHAGLVCWTGADDDLGGMVKVLSVFAASNTLEET